MRKFFALVAAVFIAALSFAYPITAHAITEGYTLETHTKYNDIPIGDTYFYFAFNNEVFRKDYLFAFSNSQYSASLNGSQLVITFNSYDLKYYRFQQSMSDNGNMTSNFDTIVYDYDTNILAFYNGIDYVDPYSCGRSPTWTTAASAYKDYKAYDYIDNCETFKTNWTAPSPLDLDFTFAPAMNGTVSRQQTISGHTYTSNTLDMTVVNNGSAAQWAMFIVPHGESITIPALQWDNSKIWTGPSIFTYVKDEWCFDHFEPVGSFDVDTTTFMPSALHYIEPNDSRTYNINWNSMKLEANTSYDVVCYAALNDRGDSAVSFSNTYIYEEVYRSNFSITDPAAFNPDNSGDGGYSWDNDTDNSSLLSMKKATQDNFGNFYVNYPDNSYTSINASVNTDVAFGSFFRFFRQVLSFFPASWITIITIGLSSIVVIGIIKAVSK